MNKYIEVDNTKMVITPNYTMFIVDEKVVHVVDDHWAYMYIRDPLVYGGHPYDSPLSFYYIDAGEEMTKSEAVEQLRNLFNMLDVMESNHVPRAKEISQKFFVRLLEDHR